jgi:RNA polymerase sigma-70 factor, ECF subfamily
MDEPDPQLVRAARRGDLGAFESLVRRYQGDVWRLVCHLVQNQGLADDITQDTFVRAFRFLPDYRGDAKFSTWLFSIARNCARDEMRRAGRRQRTQDAVTPQPEESRPERTYSMEVREALATLPLELREPLVLIDLVGCSYREVAAALAVPEGTIKSRVHRARELLAVALGPRHRRPQVGAADSEGRSHEG